MDGKTLGKLANDAGYLDMDVAAALKLFQFGEAVAAAEREACAKVCEEFDFNKREEIGPPRTLPKYLAAAIRKRSNCKFRETVLLHNTGA